jgi:hypothetical protein
VRVTVYAFVLLALAGCSFRDGDTASIEERDLQLLVLQPTDLPRVFAQFDEGRQASADSPGGSRADPSRFDRIEGWKARYRRPGTLRTAGALVIESRVDLFESADGAEEDFDAARTDLGAGTLPWKPIDEPGLGDESFVGTFVQGGTTGVRFYRIFWRDDNATATLEVNGFEGKLTLADVLALARKQQERMERAAGS